MEVNIRIGRAANNFINLKKIWTTKLVPNQAQTILLKCAENPYIWLRKLENDQAFIGKRLNAFQKKCLQMILFIKCNECNTAEIKEMSDQPLISNAIKKLRWRHIGLACRMEDNRIIKQALSWHMVGKRKRWKAKGVLWRTVMYEAKKVWTGSMKELTEMDKRRLNGDGLWQPCTMFDTKERMLTVVVEYMNSFV